MNNVTVDEHSHMTLCCRHKDNSAGAASLEASLRTFIGTYKPLTCADMRCKVLPAVQCASLHRKDVQVVCIFLGIGTAFVPLGYACLKASRSVRYLVHPSNISKAVLHCQGSDLSSICNKPLMLIAWACSCRWWRLQGDMMTSAYQAILWRTEKRFCMRCFRLGLAYRQHTFLQC